MPAGHRALGREAQRVAHHRPHRKAAEDRALGADAGSLPELVVEAGQAVEGRVEGVVVGVAHPRNHVPVVARPTRQGQRPARRGHVQAAAGVEHVGQPEQVVLVGAAPVVEHQQAGRVALGGALAKGQ